MSDLIKKKKAEKYDNIDNMDLDASLYDLGFFTSDEKQKINFVSDIICWYNSSLNVPDHLRNKNLTLTLYSGFFDLFDVSFPL